VPAKAILSLEAELERLAGAPVTLERPSRAEHGDYATNVALRLAGGNGQPPRELAEQLAAEAAQLPLVERAEVAGPGFLNLFLTPEWYAEALAEIIEAGEGYGGGFAETSERVQVEMVSANPTGPLTVGSARNGAYGDAVARLLEFAGNMVEREYYFNDVGRQIDLFRESVEAHRRGEEPPDEGYTGAYVAEIAAEPGDPVERMLREIERELEAFRIRFDSWVLQREITLEVEAALPYVDSYEAEGTLWARTSSYGDDKDRPLVRSSDGSYLYYAADVAYVRNKFERGFDRLIYVLGADHHGYVPRLKAAAAMLGYDAERLEVLIYQLVHIVEGGHAKQSSKRRGDVVFLSELVDKIGVDAARWYLVSRGHDQTIDIDVDLARERSEKNPVYYVQYAHARIAGILRNAGDAETLTEAGEPAAEERDLIKRLVEFPDVVREATARRAPHALPNYAIRLADDFHRFYHRHRVLESDRQAFRLGLVMATKAVLARSLNLVGVEAPDRM
ncbi:MAG TPA: arginine--tRNA ligase, partial [Gaiellaceae bacterium]|nr:arginine--tRNA ligase [Gaiellaceae bacterium]